MNALFENFKFNNSSNTSETYAIPSSKDFLLNISLINDPNLKEINTKVVHTCLNNNENINKIVQLLNELKFKYYKELQLKKAMDTNVKISEKENNKINSHKYEKNENKNKYADDSFSEIKKFKTELCHSWELTGTCKYGLNVNHILIIYISMFLL
jgi:hypothetical protein